MTIPKICRLSTLGVLLCSSILAWGWQDAPTLAEYVGQYHSAEEPDAVSAINLSGGTLTIEGERTARMKLKEYGIADLADSMN